MNHSPLGTRAFQKKKECSAGPSASLPAIDSSVPSVICCITEQVSQKKLVNADSVNSVIDPFYMTTALPPIHSVARGMPALGLSNG